MKRLWEIDFLRGLAIVLMVIFNYSFALKYLNIHLLTTGELYWWVFPRFIASMFIFIVGVSIVLSSPKKNYIKYLNRGLKLFFLGILITIATFLYVPQDTIWFGILHFIGLSVILGPLFLKASERVLLLSALVSMLTGYYLNSFTFDFPWLLWLGFIPMGFSTLDYFPFFPWFSLVLVGMFFGRVMYKDKKQFKPKMFRGSSILSFMGRHSLLIYVLHQPILLGLLYVMGIL